MKNGNGRSTRRQDDRDRDSNGRYSSDFNGNSSQRDTSYFRGSQNADTESGLMDFNQEDRRGRRVWDADDNNSRNDNNQNRYRDDNSDFMSDRNERSSDYRRRNLGNSDGGSYSNYSSGNNSGYGYGTYADGNYGNGNLSNYGSGGYGTRRNADYQSNEENQWGGHSQSRNWENTGNQNPNQQSHRGKGPKGYKRSDERIQEDINDWLTNDHQLDASEVEVAVSQGEVTLSGTVSSRNDKRRAEDIAESISGVTHVQNNIRINRDDNASGSGKGENKTKSNGKH